MTVVRIIHQNNFTVLNNECLRDADLSAEALGVLCYLIGKPHDWLVRPTELSARFSCGRDRIDRILKDLIESGYIHKHRERDKATGRLGAVEYVVFDTRSGPPPENTEVDQKPTSESPPTGKPAVENQEVLNTDLPNTELERTESKHCDVGKPTGADIDRAFNEFWEAYPKRIGQRGKPEARAKFLSLVKTGAEPRKMIDEAERFGKDWVARVSRKPTDAQFIPMAATWLNKRRWDDEPTTTPVGGETMFDLANHFEQRVRDQGNEQRSDESGHYRR